MKIKILEIKQKPKWKLWRFPDNWEIKVLINDEKIRTIYVYTKNPNLMLEDYIRNKIVTGNQFERPTKPLNKKLEGKIIEVDD